MRLKIKSPEGEGWRPWRTWEILLDDHPLDGIIALRLNFESGMLVTASLEVTVEELDFDGDIVAEILALVESKKGR
jgi:hypothetical protein